jgi:hypothetical protein
MNKQSSESNIIDGEKIRKFFRQHKNQLVAVGVVSLLLGFVVGYEARGAIIRMAFRDTVGSLFSDVSDVFDASDSSVKEMQIGDSFTDGGLTYTVLDAQRSDTSVTLSDDTIRDSKMGFKIHVSNTTDEDHYFNDLNFQLKSRVDDDKITTIMFVDNNKNYQPELEGNTLIDGATKEGWLTYFLPKDITNDNLQFVFQGDTAKVKFRLK